jgi:hypothetical protein
MLILLLEVEEKAQRARDDSSTSQASSAAPSLIRPHKESLQLDDHQEQILSKHHLDTWPCLT